ELQERPESGAGARNSTTMRRETLQPPAGMSVTAEMLRPPLSRCSLWAEVGDWSKWVKRDTSTTRMAASPRSMWAPESGATSGRHKASCEAWSHPKAISGLTITMHLAAGSGKKALIARLSMFGMEEL